MDRVLAAFLRNPGAARSDLEAGLRDRQATMEAEPAAIALRQVVDMVHARWDHPRRGEALGTVLRLQGELAVRRGDVAGAIQYYREAARELWTVLTPPERAQLALDQAWIYHLLGDCLTSLDLCREAASDLAAEPDASYAAALMHSLQGINHYRLGRLDEACWEHGEALSLREALGDELGRAASLNNLGNVQLDRGEWTTAEQCYRSSMEIYAALERPERVAALANNLGNLAAHRGDFDAAEAHHARALALRSQLGDRFGSGASRCAQAHTWLRAGRVGDAIQGFRRGIRLLEVAGAAELRAEALLGLGQALLVHGDLTGARFALASGRDAAHRTRSALQLGVAYLLEARLARLEQLPTLALEHVATARGHLSRASSRYELARAELEEAHALLAARQRERAREALERALTDFMTLGAAPDVLEARALAARLEVRSASRGERGA